MPIAAVTDLYLKHIIKVPLNWPNWSGGETEDVKERGGRKIDVIDSVDEEKIPQEGQTSHFVQGNLKKKTLHSEYLRSHIIFIVGSLFLILESSGAVSHDYFLKIK